jgi:hypothetical protein
MDPAHEEQLRRFQQGSTRMVVAVDTSRGDAVVPFREDHRTDAERKAYRTYVRENLVCVVAECRAPLVAHFRSAKRDGFVHKPGTGGIHEPISANHQLGAQLIARWARTHDGVGAEVEVASRDRRRRPDITITTASRARIAVEVQYARMSVADYQARSRDHTREYDARAWLLGHVGDNFTYKDGTVRLNALAQAIQADDATLLWLNSETGTVLTAWAGDDGHGPQPADRGVARAWEVVPLESCRLDERHGILTPAMLRLQAAAECREAARKARETEEREQERLEAEREQAAAAAAARRQARKERLAQERRQRWDSSPEKAWLIAEHNGKIPVLLTATGPGDATISQELGVTTVHWKTSVYQHIALAEDWVAWRETCQVLARLRPSNARHRKFTDETQVWETLARFVRELGGKRLVAVRNPRQGRPVAAPLAVARAERERAYQNRPAPSPTPTGPLPPPPPPPPAEPDRAAEVVPTAGTDSEQQDVPHQEAPAPVSSAAGNDARTVARPAPRGRKPGRFRATMRRLAWWSR